jgi:hypothetical protein
MNAYPSDLVREVLIAQAEGSIPTTSDVWPEILRRRHNRAGRTGSSKLRISRRAALRGIAALGLAAIMVIASAPWLSRTPTTAAAALFSELAVVAAAQPAAPGVPPGSYAYTRSETMQLFEAPSIGVTALVPRTREIWVSPDGSGRIRDKRAGDPVFFSESGRAAWIAAGSPRLSIDIDEDYGPGDLYFEDLSALPTDTAAMTALVRERASKTARPQDVQMFVVVGDLLKETGAAPEVRAALYRVAAGIPGVELIGNVRDRAGRQGVAVAKTIYHFTGTQRDTLIFDPTTSTLLGTEMVRTPWLYGVATKEPTMVSYVVYLESEVIEQLPAR